MPLTQWLEYRPTCSSCSQGKVKTVSQNHVCVNCPQGKYNNNVQQINSQCVRVDNKVSKQCNSGKYYNNIIQSCDMCEVGKYSNWDRATPAYTEQNSCYKCPAGLYQDIPGSTTNRFLCTLSSVGPCICDLGWESISTQCQPCTKGSYAPLYDTCWGCPVSKFSDQETSKHCIECLEYKNCVNCPAGTYAGRVNLHGQSTCKKCPDGTFFSPAGSLSINDCVKCEAGKAWGYTGVMRSCKNQYHTCTGVCLEIWSKLHPESRVGSWNYMDFLTDTTSCFNCNGANQYSPQRGSTICSICPETLHVIHNNTACGCNIRTYQVASGNSQTCQTCDEGTYSHAGMTSCWKCPQESFYTSDDAHSNCACITGYTLGVSGCEKCEFGKYKTKRGNKSCISCTIGVYVANIADDTCIRCPEGKYITNNLSYIDCVHGSYVLVAATTCLFCDEIFFLSGTECKQCPPGTLSVFNSKDIESCFCPYFNCCDGINNVIAHNNAMFFNNFSRCDTANLLYDEVMLPTFGFNSTVCIHYTFSLLHVSELVFLIDDTTIHTLSADYDSEVDKHEVLEITVQRKSIGHEVVSGGYDDRLCELYINKVKSVRVLRCSEIERFFFMIKANLLYLHTVWLLHDNLLVATWDYNNEDGKYGNVCVNCSQNTVYESGICRECFTGALVEVDSSSQWWADDMWETNSFVSYFPQWTNKNKNNDMGLMRYNEYDTEGNLYFSPIDTYTTDDNVLLVCQVEYITMDIDLYIISDTRENVC